MNDFIINKIARPALGEVLYVHSLSIEALQKFLRTRIRCSTDDKPEQAQAVFKAINRPELFGRQFACATPYLKSTPAATLLEQGYSEGSGLALILELEQIKNRTLIFNGDVANLGNALLQKQIMPDFVQVMTPTDDNIVSTLTELRVNNTRSMTPRLYGGSFEARMFGGIRPDDVQKIYVQNQNDKDAMNAAQQLYDLRQALSGDHT